MPGKDSRFLMKTPELVSSGQLLVRGAEPRDVPAMARWLSDPKVLEFYHGRDRAMDEPAVRAHYFVRRRDASSGRFYEYRACIVEMQGRPIGFVQYFRPDPNEAMALGLVGAGRTFGMDLFIGEPALWGKGLGSSLVRLMRDFLVNRRGADRIVLDPRVDNLRAIRAYEKAGFRRIRPLPKRELHEGMRCDCWLMEYRGASRSGRQAGRLRGGRRR